MRRKLSDGTRAKLVTRKFEELGCLPVTATYLGWLTRICRRRSVMVRHHRWRLFICQQDFTVRGSAGETHSNKVLTCWDVSQDRQPFIFINDSGGRVSRGSIAGGYARVFYNNVMLSERAQIS